ncbi:MAG: REP-associated tyrosine transposase [Isosphaeraceae bacterium]
MPDYRRAHVPGGMYFFTLVTERRAAILTDPTAREFLRQAFANCRARWPFRIEAIVLLPDHLHAIWSLPPGDANYSLRWAWIKKEFTKSWIDGGGAEETLNDSRHRNRRRGVWQRRFWEHYLEDEDDLERHCDYIHYNPVKHGLVRAPMEWPYSSFHRFVRLGAYPPEWGRTEDGLLFRLRPIKDAGE